MRPGDKVKIIKPANIKYEVDTIDPNLGAVNSWVEDMDVSVGKIVTLDEYDPDSGWWMTDAPYGYLECWLEFVSESADSAFERAMKIV